MYAYYGSQMSFAIYELLLEVQIGKNKERFGSRRRILNLPS